MSVFFNRGSAAVAVSLLFASGLLVSGAASPASAAAAPGQKVSGQSAAQRVEETDLLQFQPGSARVKPGEVVEWDNTGSVAHNVTFDQYPSITSGTLNGGDTYEVRFTASGTYRYHCTFHPGMDGSVTIP